MRFNGHMALQRFDQTAQLVAVTGFVIGQAPDHDGPLHFVGEGSRPLPRCQ